MNVSDDLKKFLKSNKIFDVNSIFQLSLPLFATFSGYTKKIGDEIAKLKQQKRLEYTTTKGYLELPRQENMKEGVLTVTDKFGNEIFSTVCPMPTSEQTIALSTRLKNLVTLHKYDKCFLDFLSIDDMILLGIRGFGGTCLNEVQEIRRVLSISLNTTSDSGIVEGVSPGRILRINIPKELRNLEFKAIFCFVQNLESLSLNVVTRLMRCFVRLGELNDKTFEDLYKIKGLGKKALEFLRKWLGTLQIQSFDELSKQLTNLHNEQPGTLDTSIKCSYFCNRFLATKRIDSIIEIASLDKAVQLKLPRVEKLAILELRTLYFDSANRCFRTKSNNVKSSNFDLASDVDSFLNGNFISRSSREMIILRWDENGKKISYEEIAQLNNLTRERVRQILQKTFEIFKLLFISDTKSYLEYFYDKLLANMRPIQFEDICIFPQTSLSFLPNFYLAFLSDIFDSVPFQHNLSSENRIKNVVDEIQEMASVPWKFELVSTLEKIPLEKKIEYLHALFATDKLHLAKRQNKYFVNRASYGINSLLRACVNEIDRPVKLQEIVDYLKKSPYCRSKKLLKAIDEASYSTLLSLIGNLDDFIRVERYLWAFEKHLSYPKSTWPKIQKACLHVLEELGHQADAGFLFKKIKQTFPLLRSKYEVAHILKSSSELTNLGFLNFAPSTSGQQERVTIKNIVQELFEKDWKPKSFKVLSEEIKKRRAFRPESIGIMHRQFDFLKLYTPGYYGFKSRDSDNREFLKKNIDYIEAFVSYRREDTTSLSDIMDELEIQDDTLSFLQFLNKSKSIVIYTPPGSQESWLFSKNWSIVRIMVSLLANFNKEKFFDELNLIAKNELKLEFDTKTTRYRLENDKRVSVQKNRSFIYNSIIKERGDYSALLDEIEEFFNITPELLYIDKLYDTIYQRSENKKPESANDLLTLLRIDNRFEIFEGDMVGIL